MFRDYSVRGWDKKNKDIIILKAFTRQSSDFEEDSYFVGKSQIFNLKLILEKIKFLQIYW
ncbi:hypothetical protein BTR23_09295 [Alkalihalophilus pseudofirmus]|nr:hypothetical protein BTR23_09295 [Alkalihalophilus pseudofirmus]